ncbi:ABC transporter permease [Bacillus vallismortis]
MNSRFHLLKRDIMMRLHDCKATFLFISLAALLIYFVSFWNSYKSGQLDQHNILNNYMNVFHSLNFFELHELYSQHKFSIPFTWICLQIFPLLIIGHFSYNDFQKSGTLLIPKLNNKLAFWLSKLFSLWIFCLIIWAVWFSFYFIFFLIFKGTITIGEIKPVLSLMLIQYLVTTVYTLFFETLTYFFSYIISLVISIVYLIISIFVHSKLFFTSLAIPGRWYFADHSSINMMYSYGSAIHFPIFIGIITLFCILCCFVGMTRIKKLDILGD